MADDGRTVDPMTEQQPYEVVQRYPEFELRRYPSHAVAEISVRGSFDSAGNQAFRSLFKYITGHNESAGSVAMTAPVVQEPPGSETIAMTAPVVQTQAEDGEHLVAFVLPASLTAATAPVPTDPRVRIRQVPDRVAAAVRYSGRWSESGYRRHLADLEAGIARAGLVATGPPRFARFDPPFKPWFLRRNEVVQDVEWRDGD
ncbi:heme-binding protein [Dietzia cercidiphylli]|uniref:Heme-binding protein n=2 Tax=Dietzia cercidiphylli TaxID=498199 RepID=A0ABN2I647_9ACTN